MLRFKLNPDMTVRSIFILRNSRNIINKSTILGRERRQFSVCNNRDTLPIEEKIVTVEHQEEITLIGLNRPEKRNALNGALVDALRKELKNFENDKSSKIAILHGNGGSFCAGIDLNEVVTDQNFESLPLIDEYCSKPVIASVTGYAVAEGFDLAMACDMRIVDDTAIFGHFNRRFGNPISPTAISRLKSCVGFAHAMEMILFGRPITAEEAFQKGLASIVTTSGACRGQAFTSAKCLTKFPQAGMLCDRAALHKTLDTVSTGLEKKVNDEYKINLAISLQERRDNSARFKTGVGKHGTFKNLFLKTIPEWMEVR